MIRKLHEDQRGAVLAEFMLVIVPVLTMFLSFVQLAKVATARLVVKHGAIIGARAASVISNANDNNPGVSGSGAGDIRDGVKVAMGPWVSRGSISNVSVNVADSSNRSDYYGWVRVTVRVTYHCTVPLGWLACSGPTKTLEESYRMPHQGAAYRL